MEKHEREEILGITAAAKKKEEATKAASPPVKITHTKILEPSDDYLQRHFTDINERFCYVLDHDDDSNDLYEYKNRDIGNQCPNYIFIPTLLFTL